MRFNTLLLAFLTGCAAQGLNEVHSADMVVAPAYAIRDQVTLPDMARQASPDMVREASPDMGNVTDMACAHELKCALDLDAGTSVCFCEAPTDL